MGRRGDKVTWWEPIGFHRRRFVEDLRRQGLLSLWFWIRPPLLGLSLLVCAWVAAKWRYGALPLPHPIWTLVLLVFLVPAMLWVVIGIQWLIPERFALSAWGLSRWEGNPRPAKLIDELRIERAAEGRVLVIRSTRPKRPTREVRTLLPAYIEPEALEAVLPENLSLVRDDRAPHDDPGSDAPRL